MTAELLNTAQPYKVITFDVFDTLLLREVVKPTEVFELAGGKAFRYMRIAAEMFARKTSAKDDITLEEIYKFLPGRNPAVELEWERKVCYANPSIQEIYKVLKKQGKKIYAISDMYLPAEFVKELLERNGYFVDDVYVSSTYRVCKVTGKLYQKLCVEQGIAPKEILHIGDSEMADVQGAKKAGIKAFHVPKDKNLLLYSKLTNENRRLCGYINHQLNGIDDRCERLGYEILGPIFVSFCQWLHKKKDEFRFEKLFFLARDMYIPLKIYSKLYGKDDVRYLCVSRKSLSSAVGHKEHLIAYLKREGCFGNVAIVDTGWRGVMQIILDHYAKQIDLETVVGGLYLGVNRVFDEIEQLAKTDNCFCSSKKMKRKAYIYATLLEALIGYSEPKVVDYGIDGTPLFDENVRNVKKISSMQKGAEKFADHWKERGNKEINTRWAFLAFCNLCDRPHKEDISELGMAEFDDTETSTLVKFRGHKYYLKHLKEWFDDLRLSAWKGAFFQKSFPYMEVFYKGYFWLDSYLLYFADRRKLKGKSAEELLRFY